MKKIITSIVGTGRMANEWANLVNRKNNFFLKNVVSRSENRGIDFANRHKCKFISNSNQIVEDRDIDLVIVCSNPEVNKLAIEFSKNKKNLILEKPLSLNLSDSELIFSQCKKDNIICAAGLNRHYDTFFSFVNKHVEILGACFHAEYKKYYKGEKTDEEFSLKRTQKTGGIFLGGLVHQFDQVNKLFGKPESLIATELGSTNENVIVDTNILVKYEKGITCNFSKKLDCKYNFGEFMTLYCENGLIEINFNIQTVSAICHPFNNKYSRAVLSRFKHNLFKKKKLTKFNKKKIIASQTFWQGGQENILDNFSKVFFGGKNIDLVDITNNYNTSKMAFACIESIKANGWVKIF